MTDDFITFEDFMQSLQEESGAYNDFNELLKDKKIVLAQYDMDTIPYAPGFYPGEYAINPGKNEYMGYIYDEIIKHPEDSDMCYDFILVNNGKIIAMGDEQGRCGGITCSCRNVGFPERLKKSRAYDKVAHLPIALSDELEEPIYRYFGTYQEYQEFFKEQQP